MHIETRTTQIHFTISWQNPHTVPSSFSLEVDFCSQLQSVRHHHPRLSCGPSSDTGNSAPQLTLGQWRWHHPPTIIMHFSAASYMAPKQLLKHHVYREKRTLGFFPPLSKSRVQLPAKYSGCMGSGGTQIWDFPDKCLGKQMQLPIACRSPSGIIFSVHNDPEISFPQPSDMKYCIPLALWGRTVIFFSFLKSTACCDFLNIYSAFLSLP